ncbi:MAG: hypothetical protein L6Q47_04145 [Ignavibacteriaceae bacterium]|nr:hypothetical protein [Ignavibacteriaceae bacterium]
MSDHSAPENQIPKEPSLSDPAQNLSGSNLPPVKKQSPLVLAAGLVILLLLVSVVLFLNKETPQTRIEALIVSGKITEAEKELAISELPPQSADFYRLIISAIAQRDSQHYFNALLGLRSAQKTLIKTSDLKNTINNLETELLEKTAALTDKLNTFFFEYTNTLLRNDLANHLSLFADTAVSQTQNPRRQITAEKSLFFTSFRTIRHKMKLLSVSEIGNSILAIRAEEELFTENNDNPSQGTAWVRKYFEAKQTADTFRLIREEVRETILNVSAEAASYKGYTFTIKKHEDDWESSVILKTQSGETIYTQTTAQAEFFADDYDNDSQLELMVRTYSGGAHCCYTLSVWELEEKPVLYSPGLEIFGMTISFEDIDQDGKKEFSTVNYSYDYAFTSHAGSVFPPMVYEYSNNQFRENTVKYTTLLKQHLQEIKAEIADFLTRLEHPNTCQSMQEIGWGADYKALIAAAVTDIYLLNGEPDAFAFLDEYYTCPDKPEFKAAVKKLYSGYKTK